MNYPLMILTIAILDIVDYKTKVMFLPLIEIQKKI